MSSKRKTFIVSFLLAVIWSAMVVWQVWEHQQRRYKIRQTLENRAQDVAVTLEVVLDSQERFGVIAQPRLKAALTELSKRSDVLSIGIVNPTGEPLVIAGLPFEKNTGELDPGTSVWTDDHLTVVRLFQLRRRRPETQEGQPEPQEDRRVLLIEDFPHRRPNRNSTPPPENETQEGPSKGLPMEVMRPPAPRPPPEPSPEMGEKPPENPDQMGNQEDRKRFGDWVRRRGWRERGAPRRAFPWIDEARYRELFEKHGLQKIIIVLDASVGDLAGQVARDAWLRLAFIIATLAAGIALAIGWRSQMRSNDLQLRLVRAGEMNTHLQEMNIAAAGLAHETRNPLNVVRGLARLIADDKTLEDENRQRAGTVIEEVDRVNSRLEEFIAYSRPRPPSLAPVSLRPLVQDVLRTLEVDCEEKQLEVKVDLPDVSILADSSQFRQVVFNLLINACQALPKGGCISVSASCDDDQLTLSIRDNGPGVPPESREDIFRPYFTLAESGTGLGLAVVRRIVLAHHGEITYSDTPGGGATFTVSGLETA